MVAQVKHQGTSARPNARSPADAEEEMLSKNQGAAPSPKKARECERQPEDGEEEPERDHDELAEKTEEDGDRGKRWERAKECYALLEALSEDEDSSSGDSAARAREKRSKKSRDATTDRLGRQSITSAMPTIEISPGDVNDKYDIGRSGRIGRGFVGTVVWKGVERETGRECAVKSVPKSMPKQIENLRREVALLKPLVHPNILKIYDVFEDDENIHLVTELCEGGELYESITPKKRVSKLGRRWEREVAVIVRQILRAIAYCHALNIIHRDLKLENVLLKPKKKKKGTGLRETDVCIINFGLAAQHDASRMAPRTSVIGTPYYVAPEVLGKSYDNKWDIWSLGVMTYNLLCAKPPFDGNSIEEMYDSIQSKDCQVEFPSEDWDGASDAAKEFIRGLLEEDPAMRPSAAEMLEHRWIRENASSAPSKGGADFADPMQPAVSKSQAHQSKRSPKKKSKSQPKTAPLDQAKNQGAALSPKARECERRQPEESEEEQKREHGELAEKTEEDGNGGKCWERSKEYYALLEALSEDEDSSSGDSAVHAREKRPKKSRDATARRQSRQSITSAMPKIEITPGDINDKYDIDRSGRIGRGFVGTVVRKGIERETGRECAVKSVPKSMPQQIENLRREVALLNTFDHPNIIEIYDLYEDEKHLHLVMELCEGGELYDTVKAKKKNYKLGRRWEPKAASIVRQILQALDYCQERHIVHRDLKLENVLLKSKKKGCTDFCIIDFGLAAMHNSLANAPRTSLVGTPLYVPPEVLKQSYDNKCDIWSLGVLTYTLLSGTPPFDGETLSEMYRVILSEESHVKFPSQDWWGISDEAKEFIRSMLKRDPALRPSAAELLEHEWIRANVDSSPPSSPVQKLKRVLQKMKSFN